MKSAILALELFLFLVYAAYEIEEGPGRESAGGRSKRGFPLPTNPDSADESAGSQ